MVEHRAAAAMVKDVALGHEEREVPALSGQFLLHQGMGDLGNEFVDTACLVGGDWRSRLLECSVHTAVAGVRGSVDAPVHQALGCVDRCRSLVLVGVVRPIRAVIVVVGTQVEVAEGVGDHGEGIIPAGQVEPHRVDHRTPCKAERTLFFLWELFVLPKKPLSNARSEGEPPPRAQRFQDPTALRASLLKVGQPEFSQPIARKFAPCRHGPHIACRMSGCTGPARCAPGKEVPLIIGRTTRQPERERRHPGLIARGRWPSPAKSCFTTGVH